MKTGGNVTGDPNDHRRGDLGKAEFRTRALRPASQFSYP
jgi:hypothetical protein